MKVFTVDCVYDNEKFPETSSLKHHYKETEEGVNVMSDIIERLWGEDKQKVFEEGKKEGKSDILNTIIKNGMPPEELSKYSNIPVSEIKALSAVH
ncbi:MAG: hypothetical protein K6G15_05305 [Desulfovibrio sp.]|nr:hypothetical protein [Desulfovibrio sp.]